MKQVNQTSLTQTDFASRVCPKCNQITKMAETKCSKCGRALHSVTRIRILGALSVIIGISVLSFMSWLSLWMYKTITQSAQPGAATTFNGGPQEIAFIIFVFGLVMTIGFCSTVAGVWQLIFGKRNKILTVVVLLLGAVFVGTGLIISLNNHI